MTHTDGLHAHLPKIEAHQRAINELRIHRKNRVMQDTASSFSQRYSSFDTDPHSRSRVLGLVHSLQGLRSKLSEKERWEVSRSIPSVTMVMLDQAQEKLEQGGDCYRRYFEVKLHDLLSVSNECASKACVEIKTSLPVAFLSGVVTVLSLLRYCAKTSLEQNKPARFVQKESFEECSVMTDEELAVRERSTLSDMLRGIVSPFPSIASHHAELLQGACEKELLHSVLDQIFEYRKIIDGEPSRRILLEAIGGGTCQFLGDTTNYSSEAPQTILQRAERLIDEANSILLAGLMSADENLSRRAAGIIAEGMHARIEVPIIKNIRLLNRYLHGIADTSEEERLTKICEQIVTEAKTSDELLSRIISYYARELGQGDFAIFDSSNNSLLAYLCDTAKFVDTKHWLQTLPKPHDETVMRVGQCSESPACPEVFLGKSFVSATLMNANLPVARVLLIFSEEVWILNGEHLFRTISQSCQPFGSSIHAIRKKALTNPNDQ
jgi:hypothetical protein